MQRDAVLVGQPHQRLPAVGYGVHDGAALLAHLSPAHEVRQRVGEILLYEALFRDAAGVSPQSQWSVPDMGKHRVGHCGVVVDQITLGDAVVGEQHSIGMGDLDVDAGHQRVSLSSSSGAAGGNGGSGTGPYCCGGNGSNGSNGSNGA